MLVVVSWRCAIAVDVGGTFTDLAVVGTDGRRHTAKVPSVPSDPSQGVLDVLDVLAGELAMTASALLARCDRFVHGSTVATNALLTGRVARVGLVTSAGFRDSLEIRRGLREDQWDHRAPWPPVLVPRSLRRPVRGRVDASGAEIEQLVVADVDDAIDVFLDQGVESVAVCLLHSYGNPAHERAVAELVRREWPGPLTTVSSELVPHLGEYARTSTTVVNAGLVPLVGEYLGRLAGALEAGGLGGPLLMLQSNGGTVPIDAVSARPVDLVLSGPAAVGGATRRLTSDGATLVTMEIGGTSCDVAVAVDGSVPVVDGLVVGGYHLDVPAVDVHTIGAGGGTIAHIDATGFLHVGPDGAGAEPGPACYGRGGSEPTATDAHLVLGRLRPGPYAGGSIELDESLARRAIAERIAEPLGLEVDEAAIGILTLLEEHLRHAVETITIQRGRDPRSMTMVAAGGAGGLHGSRIARALGCRRLVVPAEAGVFCALGMLDSDLRRDVSRSTVGRLDDLGAVGVLDLLADEQDRTNALIGAEWPDGVAATSTWYADLRYPGQMWSVRVSVDPAATTVSLRTAFEQEYARRYGHVQASGEVEITGVGVVALGAIGLAPAVVLETTDLPVPIERRRCWLDPTSGWQEVPVYAGADLGAGATLEGPFVIEDRTTTVLGGIGDRAVVGAGGDLEVELA